MADTAPITHAELHDAVNALRWFVPRLKGVLALGDKMDQLASLINAEGETRARVTELQTQAAAVNAVVAGADAAQLRLDGINAELARYDTKMKAEREQTLQSARTEAEGIIADGRAKADLLLANARTTAAAEAKAKADSDAGEIAMREAKLAELGTEIEASQAEVHAIKQSLADLRVRIGAR
jgi:chromosome segregation ATPase